MREDAVAETSSMDISVTQNRELSWLRFDERVLDEARDATVPLLERLKFITIFSSNLDEFFMIRVGSLFDLSLVTPDALDNKTLETPMQQLEKVFAAVKPLIQQRDELYTEVMAQLEPHEVYDARGQEDLTKKEHKTVRAFYRDYVRPVLSPQVVDERHPFPHLENKKLYIAASLHDDKGRPATGIIPVPTSVPPFFLIPETDGRFMRLETIISNEVDKLFGIYEVESYCTISVTRNADIGFDEEKFDDDEDDYRRHVSRVLKKRNRLNPVRLEVHGSPAKELLDALMTRLGLSKGQVYRSECPLDLTYVYQLEAMLPTELRLKLTYPAFKPRYPVNLDPRKRITDQVKQRDRLLFYPYDSIAPFLQLLRESADDPAVVSVKITIYRLASNSQVVEQLCAAAENGKDVTVLMELRARFDEENNIYWADRLETAGCHVIYGVDGFKCHSKICLITRHDGGRINTITQIGTGNYNEKTAKLYTDLCLLTADEKIGRDAISFFQNMLISNLEGEYQSLVVAPVGLKHRFLRLIDEETEKGEEGRIIIKANALTERDIINRLVKASQAGVKVWFNLRGICCLRPGIEGKTDNITVTSIVGRFLEHSRIYCFGDGADAKLFISSADLMTRNITRRVEIACPIEDPKVKLEILDFLTVLSKDNTKSRKLLPDGTYMKPEVDENTAPFDVQSWLIDHPLQEARRNELRQPEERRSAWQRFIARFQR